MYTCIIASTTIVVRVGRQNREFSAASELNPQNCDKPYDNKQHAILGFYGLTVLVDDVYINIYIYIYILYIIYTKYNII